MINYYFIRNVISLTRRFIVDDWITIRTPMPFHFPIIPLNSQLFVG